MVGTSGFGQVALTVADSASVRILLLGESRPHWKAITGSHFTVFRPWPRFDTSTRLSAALRSATRLGERPEPARTTSIGECFPEEIDSTYKMRYIIRPALHW